MCTTQDRMVDVCEHVRQNKARYPGYKFYPCAPDASELCNALFRDMGSPSFGNSASRLAIVAFLDYRCPYCRTLADILATLHTGDVRIVYREWPVLGEPSVLAARAALAAGKQGAYLAFHARLMKTRFVPTGSYIDAIARELGLNLPALHADMQSAETTKAIADTAAAASALGLLGTPALVVGRTVVQGEITRTQLDRLIEDESMRSQKPC